MCSVLCLPISVKSRYESCYLANFAVRLFLCLFPRQRLVVRIRAAWLVVRYELLAFVASARTRRRLGLHLFRCLFRRWTTTVTSWSSTSCPLQTMSHQMRSSQPISWLSTQETEPNTQTSLCSASFVSCQRGTARIRCWAHSAAIDRYLLPPGHSAANPVLQQHAASEWWDRRMPHR